MTIENNSISEAQAAEQKSNDAKLILAPLAKYAAVAVIMASVIITTAIMLDRELNPIDHDVARLKTKLADANALALVEANDVQDDAVVATSNIADVDATTDAESTVLATEEVIDANQTVASVVTLTDTADVTETLTSVATTETEIADTETLAIAEATAEATAQTIAETDATIAETQTVSQLADNALSNQTPVQPKTSKANHVSRIDELKASMQTHIAKRNNYLKSRDTENLENFRASQQKMIEWMGQQLADQQAIIEQMRARNQDAYETRAASIKRMQEARDRSLERI